jgi:chromosome segregation ATPase
MSYGFGLTIESLVAILLLATILYCARLNAQIERLRKDEGAMQRTVGELAAAGEKAERAIAALKQTLRECEDTLTERLKAGEQVAQELSGHLKTGEELMTRLARIAAAAQPPAPQPEAPRDANAIVAAAAAFAERARNRAAAGLAA